MDQDHPPALLPWSTDSAAAIERLLLADTLHLAVTPLGGNGEEYAELATDYAELILRYRLP